jgi:xylan 1,4-beta-xylosidase
MKVSVRRKPKPFKNLLEALPSLLGLTVLYFLVVPPGFAFEQLGPVITIDFSQQGRVQTSMAGFLHSMDAHNPPDHLITPLKPGAWRGGTLTKRIYARAIQAGASYTVVMSDYWGYDPANPPYKAYPAYEDRMRKIVRATKELPIIYDIWNEPNGKDFWRGTPQEFLETFTRAYKAIREERPDAVIVGPSLNTYNPLLLRMFLDYCLAAKLRIDALSWHEYRSGDQMPEISRSLLTARATFLDNQHYAPIGLREIHVNEGISEKHGLSPAYVLAYFEQLEKGKADMGVRSGFRNDWNATLDGLLTPRDFQPRAVWWAYKAYADGLDSRMGCDHDDGAHLFCLASKGSSTSPGQLLVGTYSRSALRATLHFKNLPVEQRGFRVGITTIPDKGPGALRQLQPPRNVYIQTADKEAFIRLDLIPGEVYLLKLAR